MKKEYERLQGELEKEVERERLIKNLDFYKKGAEDKAKKIKESQKSAKSA